jgi:hypothetical protein
MEGCRDCVNGDGTTGSGLAFLNTTTTTTEYAFLNLSARIIKEEYIVLLHLAIDLKRRDHQGVQSLNLRGCCGVLQRAVCVHVPSA